MKTESDKELAAWKKQFPFYLRILYTIGGYPPYHQKLSSNEWDKWKNRFNKPEYDWRTHSGTKKKSQD